MKATLLDPRFKQVCFEEHETKLAAQYVKTDALIESFKYDETCIEPSPPKRQKLETVSVFLNLKFRYYS